MAFLHSNDKRALLKRPSDGDIGGYLRNEEMKKHMGGSMDEMQMLRDLYPDYDPTTAQKLNETQSAINGWLASVQKLQKTEDIWVAQGIVNELLFSIGKSGYNVSKLMRERREFDVNKRMNQMNDATQSQNTTVKQDRLFDFDILLEKFKQLRNIIEKAGTQLLQRGRCDIEEIMTKLEEARSVIPNTSPSKCIPPCLDSRAMDVPAHKHGRINSNDSLEKHPSRPDAINSRPERRKAEVDKLECAATSMPTMTAIKAPQNDKDAVVMWKHVAKSLSTMQSVKLPSDADILNLA
ncbi:hypothetical protein VE04_08862, partial [Pseudogymnoascus sp. 24MN13]